MRVSDSMMSELSKSGLGTARSRLAEAQRAASTGMRVNAPSDDAVAASAARRRSSDIERIEAMSKTANAGAFGLLMMDSAFGQMSDVLDRARELAVQAANESTSTADRQAIATEVQALREQMVALANTKVDGKYVLNGFREDTPPYDSTGTFVGDRNVREVEVAPGLRAQANVPVGNVLSPTSGGVDVMAVLDQLHTALVSDDTPNIRVGLDNLATAVDQVSLGRASAGTAQSTMEMAKSVSDRLVEQATNERSALVDADAFDSYSELARAQTALQNATAIAAQMPSLSLIQQMR